MSFFRHAHDHHLFLLFGYQSTLTICLGQVRLKTDVQSRLWVQSVWMTTFKKDSNCLLRSLVATTPSPSHLRSRDNSTGQQVESSVETHVGVMSSLALALSMVSIQSLLHWAWSLPFSFLTGWFGAPYPIQRQAHFKLSRFEAEFLLAM